MCALDIIEENGTSCELFTALKRGFAIYCYNNTCRDHIISIGSAPASSSRTLYLSPAKSRVRGNGQHSYLIPQKKLAIFLNRYRVHEIVAITCKEAKETVSSCRGRRMYNCEKMQVLDT